jgi:hypothetical protein
MLAAAYGLSSGTLRKTFECEKSMEKLRITFERISMYCFSQATIFLSHFLKGFGACGATTRAPFKCSRPENRN